MTKQTAKAARLPEEKVCVWCIAARIDRATSALVVSRSVGRTQTAERRPFTLKMQAQPSVLLGVTR
jgi:hypothetical protein